MAVTVKFFASLRERMGQAESLVAYAAPMSVESVWQSVSNEAIEAGEILAAVNLEYVDWEHPVEDGDEVAFFPPVTGG
ncbi:MAG: MoaD/ThiS family protein [Gammaproteobacteria bacterium]|nr:MoaD/ThiS family protein [Gammaproteobacteria bacterium]